MDTDSCDHQLSNNPFRGEPGAVKVARRVRRAARETEQQQCCHRAPGRPNWHHVSTRKRGPRELTGMVDLTRDSRGTVRARL
ncbi:MAG: hypothetical protein EOL89_11790, partial [Actinobacteria bacterium]|nr:hypothetical protein [Actinomycetota bacterium]